MVKMQVENKKGMILTLINKFHNEVSLIYWSFKLVLEERFTKL
jgi:hypothetical protein